MASVSTDMEVLSINAPLRLGVSQRVQAVDISSASQGCTTVPRQMATEWKYADIPKAASAKQGHLLDLGTPGKWQGYSCVYPCTMNVSRM